MKRILAVLIMAFAAVGMTVAKDKSDKVYLSGQVKAAITNIPLTDAYVLWPDSSGTGVDSIRCNMGMRFRNGEREEMSYFSVKVPRRDSVFVFDVVCEGYTPQTLTFKLEKVGKRETWRDIPMIMLERAPHKLKEVTVTASKIKFFNKGDTVVFNADAFQLAEGSMLDGLIAQLPGVELNNDGQIKVNGEFVESLLLNGKEFLDGNNNLMLENIAAYTVKNVEVYRGESRTAKWIGDTDAPKQLTMNVKLKKEYNMGWLINAQGGAGTEDRYSGRLFAQWFTQTQRLTFLGNVNNLNDNRRPGKSDTWSPESMPTGTRRYRMGAVDYDYENPSETVNLDASVSFEQTMTNDFTTSAVTNFLGDRNTYENSFNGARTKDTRLNSKASLWLRNNNASGYLSLTANYRRKTNDGSNLSATFDSEQKDIDMEVLETLYTEAAPSRLESVINRAATRTEGSMRQLDLRVTPGGSIKIPGSGDRLQLETYFRYNNQKEERWNDYTVNYGADPTPAVRRRQYFDDSPNRIITSVNNLTYNVHVNIISMSFNYEYRFSEQDKDSYMYALERLEDMGMFGVLPAGYLDTFDPSNSYTSRLIENKHSIMPFFAYLNNFEKSRLTIRVRPEFSLRHQRLNYWRDGRKQLVRQTSYIVTAGRYSCWFDYEFGGVKRENGRGSDYRHELEYRFELNPTTPDPFHRLDVINDSDPLNITLGNDDLKTAYKFVHRIDYSLTPPQMVHPIRNEVSFYIDHTTNALTRGYVYDTSTGVRTTRTYNVDGNYSAALTNNFNLQFGRKNQFTLTSESYGSTEQLSDMIGVDMTEPTPSRVKNLILSEKLKFAWQIGNQTLTATAAVGSRRSTSDRDDFAPINAINQTYGLIGNFKLPAGFGIATDFNVYVRSGYGMSAIDKTTSVWNARVSYNPPRARRWVFMLDGFDLLHQLSNINYAVTATGRTVSYTNALPRYVMLSVQYRLSIQPKKK